jgi:2-keto-4-pentenoate hydratase
MSVDAVIEALSKARRAGQPADAEGLSVAVPTPDDAYLVQAALANELDWFADAPPAHWKSGGASRSAGMTHAPLPPAGVWASPARAGSWPFHLRGIEAEVALRLGQAVDAATAARLDLAGAAALVDAMCVSIEVVDSRWAEGLAAPALARTADMQCHGALVLSAWQPFVARDWAAQVCRVRIGAQAEQRFVGSLLVGDPLFVLPAWLRHATQDGQVLPAGTVVTTGSWCGLLMAQAGDTVEVVFDGLGEASLRL